MCLVRAWIKGDVRMEQLGEQRQTRGVRVQTVGCLPRRCHPLRGGLMVRARWALRRELSAAGQRPRGTALHGSRGSGPSLSFRPVLWPELRCSLGALERFLIGSSEGNFLLRLGAGSEVSWCSSERRNG